MTCRTHNGMFIVCLFPVFASVRAGRFLHAIRFLSPDLVPMDKLMIVPVGVGQRIFFEMEARSAASPWSVELCAFPP